MIINNPDSLKSWLVVVLEPLCDADSSALARYVLALLKKDKLEKELKKVMIEQLDVFLGDETKPFVERLFNAISTGDYINNPSVLVPSPTEEIVVTPPVVIETKIEEHIEHNKVEPKLSKETPSNTHNDKNQIQEESKAKEKEVHNHKTKEVHDPSSSSSASLQHHSSRTEQQHSSTRSSTQANTNQVRSASPPTKAIADKENQPRENRRRRASLRSRSRSRSRSNERISRRSRSRDRRANDREMNQRQFRNKSPNESRYTSSYERRRGGGGGTDRRRINNNSNVSNNDERSLNTANTGTESTRKSGVNRSNTRSRSPSQERNRNKPSPNTMRTNRGGGSGVGVGIGIGIGIGGVSGVGVGGGGSGGNVIVSSSPDRHINSHNLHESEMRQRCRDFDEKGYCVRGETCPWDHGINPVVFESVSNPALITMSLREYNPDAPDLWSRSTPSGGVNNAQPLGPGHNSIGGSNINPFTGTVRPGSMLMGMGGPSGMGFLHVGGDKSQDYGHGPVPIGPPGFRGGAPMVQFPFNPAVMNAPMPRELISIPVVDANNSVGGDLGNMPQQNKRRFDMDDNGIAQNDLPPKRKLPLNSRLGPRLPSIQNNCSLELRKVPRGLNTIAHLNNHFAKFGKIVNIQISYDGDPEAAIVTFSTHAEANVAYRSTEAVLNNRFIKVFWHSQDPGQVANAQNIGTENAATGAPGNRKSNQYHLNNVTPVSNPVTSETNKQTNTTAATSPTTTSTSSTTTVSTSTTVTVTDTTSTSPTAVTATHVPPSSLRIKNNTPRSGLSPGASNAVIRKKQEEQAKAVVQLANGLRKRKQELLQSYFKQMKSALELVDRCDSSDPQRAKAVETIKTLQETIDKLGKEITADQELMQAQMQNQQTTPTTKKTKEQQKKELLDIELELFAQQQEGNDTTAIQKRLDELQRSMGVLGAVVGGAPTAGTKPAHFAGNRGSPRTRTSLPEGSTKVDRRPKTIVVTGFTSEEADFVLGHFKHFGEISKHDVDKDIPQLILSYATRVIAEQAIVRGKLFKDKRLHISWAPVVNAKSIPTISRSDDDQLLLDGKTNIEKLLKRNSETDMNATDTLPELRLEDEEDDDESEDRSWRR